ncbi:Hypothetical protein (Fragment) [Durusdinium trenchii]|uniref:BTB domain-containing protein n=1 Tax=Durusdinium trenchii TaxID=1381693 RepID=A0ABP0RT37_9DINO
MTKRACVEVAHDAIIPNDFGGLTLMLKSGKFSDLTVDLGSESIRAHRVLLASASDVLRAQLDGTFADKKDSWRPDGGSAGAWRWIISWIYGNVEPLPWELLVEILVVADRFGIQALVKAIMDLDVSGKAEEILEQFLDAFALPDVVTKLAMKCLPQVILSNSLWKRVAAAEFTNVALVVKHLRLTPLDEVLDPQLAEECRLKLLGESFKEKEGDLPDCFIDAIRWDVFPSAILKVAFFGDLGYFEKLLGRPWRPRSERMHQALVNALTTRCENLETRLDVPRDAPRPGLFAKFLEKGITVRISLSTQLSCMASAPLHVLLQQNKKVYGTRCQSEENLPWIEICSPDVLVDVHAIGLQHGWPDNGHRCRSFVVEARRSSGVNEEEIQWTRLLKMDDRRLLDEGEVIQIPKGSSDQREAFNCVRIRMTGPTTSYTWHLMVSWFEVFGKVKTYSGMNDGIHLRDCPHRSRSLSDFLRLGSFRAS